jgi:predicted branched-subunit amino acid permease
LLATFAHTGDPIYGAHKAWGLGQNVGVSVKSDSLSVGITVGAFGSAFGAAAIASHYTVAQACALSLLTFSGASQFAVVGVLGAGGSAFSAISTASLLGIRNGLYGVRMAQILQIKGIKRIFGAQLTIDESTGVALSQDNAVDMKTGFWYTGLGVYIFWNLFTLLGALGANALGNPADWGLDTAIPAIFLGLVWNRLKDKKSWAIAISALVLALALTPFAPAGVPIMATVILAVILGWRE